MLAASNEKKEGEKNENKERKLLILIKNFVKKYSYNYFLWPKIFCNFDG